MNSKYFVPGLLAKKYDPRLDPQQSWIPHVRLVFEAEINSDGEQTSGKTYEVNPYYEENRFVIQMYIDNVLNKEL